MESKDNIEKTHPQPFREECLGALGFKMLAQFATAEICRLADFCVQVVFLYTTMNAVKI
jgi:hypothetical protein